MFYFVGREYLYLCFALSHSHAHLKILCVSNMLLSFLSQVKYKEGWEKSKGQGFEMKLDSLPLLAAKASRDLASDVGYI